MSANSLNNPEPARTGAFGAFFRYTFWMIGVFAASVVITGLVAQLAVGLAGASVSQVVMTLMAGALLYLIALGLAIYLPYRVRRSPTTRQELGIQKPLTWMDMLLSVPAFIIATIIGIILVVIATQVVPGFDINQAQQTGFEGIRATSDKIIAFVALVILAPVAEELIFRGYFYGKLRTRRVPMVAAIMMTSLLFAVAHGQLNVGINVFGLSIILCGLREITGTIWAGVLVHMIKNGIAFYFLFINPIVSPTIGN